MKALKVTVSGSYKTGQGDIIDFEDLSGIIPFVENEYAAMHVRSRYASEWIRSEKDGNGEKVYPNRIEHMRLVHIDGVEEVDHDFSYVGKDIKKMSYEELQDLATAKDLRGIPLPRGISEVDIREMRTKAYIEYSGKILNKFIDENNPPPELSDKVTLPGGEEQLSLNFAKFPPLVVDGDIRKEMSQKVTNDEIIEYEMKPKVNDSSDLTLEDLKQIADSKNIQYHHRIGFDKLHSMVYGS